MPITCNIMDRKKITKNTTIAEVLEEHSEKVSILQKHLHAVCLGCPMSQRETLEDAAMHHDIKIDKLLEQLNKSETRNSKSETNSK